MPYVGRSTDKLSNIEKLDTIVFDGSSSYTLQKNSVNFTPSSANNLQVSIDGVVQAGNFTVSGSTIDFGVAIPATSTNDFIFHYGTGLITTPADGTVTTGKIQDGAVTSAKLSGVTQGITMADQWRLTASVSSNGDITSNLERVDNTNSGFIGTGMTESSGIFTFPQTGIYQVITTVAGDAYSDELWISANVSIDGGSNFNAYSNSFASHGAATTRRNTGSSFFIIDVTDISNVQVKFTTASIGASSLIDGSTSNNFTHFTFIRLGDT